MNHSSRSKAPLAKKASRALFAVLTMLIAAATTALIADAAADLRNPFAGNTDAVKAGEKIFDERCMDCHGGDATGGAGPDLTDEKWIYGGSDADIFTTVSRGRKGGMPSWGGQLKDEEIWQVISYIRSLAKKK